MGKHYSELAKKLLINAYKEKEGENIVCSPFSFYMLLGMALNAKIYNIDTKEYDVTKWSDLENV